MSREAVRCCGAGTRLRFSPVCLKNHRVFLLGISLTRAVIGERYIVAAEGVARALQPRAWSRFSDTREDSWG